LLLTSYFLLFGIGATTSTLCPLLSLLLPVIVLAGPLGPPLLNRRHDLVRRLGHNGVGFTYYEAEDGKQGSCGTYLKDAVYTVAVNAAEMNPSLCFKYITISYQGKTTTAQILDTCPGCEAGGLDLTPGLFRFFAGSTGPGVIDGDWEVIDSAPASPPAPAPPPQSSRLAPHPPSSRPTSTHPPSPRPTSTHPPSPKLTSTHPPSPKPTTNRVLTTHLSSGAARVAEPTGKVVETCGG